MESDGDETRPVDRASFSESGVPINDGEHGPGPVTIGRYVVLGELGAGGMGKVLRAYDPRLGREVALKRVRRARGAGEARLVREAQAMARLSHPNVVAVYDVEPLDGAVTIAMELVDGPTLRSWVRDRPRAWSEVVSTFIGAGRGLAAAHAAGLVHRDFKPSNVLMTETGEPKVTDFGLAKAASSRSEPPISESPAPSEEESISGAPESLSDSLTQAGIILGTPRFMAPEQYSGADTDGLSDQYSFCVALWQALCGQAPFEGEFEAIRDAKLRGPPSWPRAVSVPSPIADAIRRGLAVDRSQRWPSMEPLLDALAFDPSSRTRRRWWLAGGFVLATAAVGLGWRWQVQRAALCSDSARHLEGVWDASTKAELESGFLATDVVFAPMAFGRVSDTLDRYAEHWVAEHRDACEATSVRGEQSEGVLELRMTCLRRAKTELDAAVATLHDPDADTVVEAHEVVGRLAAPTRCSDVEALRLAGDAAPPKDTEAVQDIERTLASASALRVARRFDEAHALLEPALERAESLDHAPTLAEVHLALGRIETDRVEFDQSEVHLRNALRLGLSQGSAPMTTRSATALLSLVGYMQARYAEARWLQELAVQSSRRDGVEPGVQASTEMAVARLEIDRGQLADAETRLRNAVGLQTRQSGPDGNATLAARTHLGKALLARGKLEEAEQIFRSALDTWTEQLGPDHPALTSTMENLGAVALRRGDFETAEDWSRRSVLLHRRALGPDHLKTGQARLNLGVVLKVMGRLDEAEREMVAARDVLEKAYGPRHPESAFSRFALGRLYVVQGRLDESEAELRTALQRLEELYGPQSGSVGRVLESLADVMYDRRRYAEAVEFQRRSLELQRNTFSDRHPFVASATLNLARSLHKLGQLAEAESKLVEAEVIYDETVGAEHPDKVILLRTLGEVQLEREHAGDAVATLERGLVISERAQAAPGPVARLRFALARALAAAEGDAARARELAVQAREFFANVGEEGAEDAARIDRWLVSAPR